jgi:stage II sporulation protein D
MGEMGPTIARCARNPLCAVAGVLVLGFAPAWSEPASAGSSAPEPVIRVLLKDQRRVTLRRGARGGKDTLIEVRKGHLVANRKPIGTRWRLKASSDGILRADGMRVRGDLVAQRAGSRVQVINELGIEDYVAGTIGREVYPGWHRETLKAQAVVARTYALYRRQRARSASPSADFDLGSGTGSQVYGGVDAETPALVAAVAETRGEILAHQGEPILAAYHSAAGGQTATAQEVWGQAVPYLISVPVPEEQDSPDTYWRATISRPKLGRALTSLGIRIGSIRDAEVAERSPSGRALRVRLHGIDAGGKVNSHTMEARALRSALGDSVIRSTMFEIRENGDDFVIVGSGHGHGVGMSQWGAESMAQRGHTYRQILDAFYPGALLVRDAYLADVAAGGPK